MRRSKVSVMMAPFVGALLVTTSLALAQGAQPPRMEGAKGTAGAFTMNNLQDYEVVNQRNETIGTIADFVMSPQGRVRYIALSPASWWGSTEQVYFVPWSALTPHREAGRLVLNMSQEHLQSAPHFNRNNWPNLASADWDANLQRYYGQQMAQQGQQQGQQRMMSQPRGQQDGQQAMQRSGDETLMHTSVLFRFGDTQLDNEARSTLDRLATQLRNSNYESIHLTGLAGPIGSEATNFETARRRTARVAAYLVQQGVEPYKIRTLALGEETAQATGREAELAQERRVDIAVLGPKMASGSERQPQGLQQGQMRQGQIQQGQQGLAGGARIAGTVQDIDTGSRTLTMQTDYGDSVELSASEALLQNLQAGDRIEVRLNKVEGTSGQQYRGHTEQGQQQQAQ